MLRYDTNVLGRTERFGIGGVAALLCILAMGVVIGAGEAGNASLTEALWFDELIDEPTPRADMHQFADPGLTFRHNLACCLWRQ